MEISQAEMFAMIGRLYVLSEKTQVENAQLRLHITNLEQMLNPTKDEAPPSQSPTSSQA